MSEPSRGQGSRGKRTVVPRGKGRRSQAEREQLSQAEKEKNREKDRIYSQQLNVERLAAHRREREKARITGRGNRGGRGRGGYMGDSRPGVAAGAFSAGSVITGSFE
jgi:DNA-directed RNA polymerase III subunit RPC4